MRSFQDQTHILLHKPTFIPKYFSNKLKKNTFWWPFLDNLIEWIFLHDEVFKNFISRKNMLS